MSAERMRAGRADVAPRCLVYAPYSFSGRGPAESCAQIAGGMQDAGWRTVVHAGRSRTPLPTGVAVEEPFALVTHRLPWRTVERPALRALEGRFRRSLAAADPRTTVAHFWPGAPASAVRAARARGVVTVREMINSACATSGPLLDAAYARLDLAPNHLVTRDVIDGETAELGLYDYFFASNPEVEKSLTALGIEPERILPTSFGWSPTRFGPSALAAGTARAGQDGHAASHLSAPTPAHPFRAVFVGRIGVRKGVPELLEAWDSLDVDGELLLVGAVDEEIRPLVDRHVAGGRVRLAGYVDNPADLYVSSDVFVFPTWEEGGPQVTYEAAACGLPVVTTPMGAARLVEDGRTGLVVPAGAPDRLAQALGTLAHDTATRRAYGAAARDAATAFTYPQVGAQRAALLREVLRTRGATAAA